MVVGMEMIVDRYGQPYLDCATCQHVYPHTNHQGELLYNVARSADSHTQPSRLPRHINRYIPVVPPPSLNIHTQIYLFTVHTHTHTHTHLFCASHRHTHTHTGTRAFHHSCTQSSPYSLLTRIHTIVIMIHYLIIVVIQKCVI